MRIVLLLATLVGVFGLTQASQAEHAKTPTFPASDWPWWRGPNRDGVADADQTPPLQWSEKQNVIWKAPIPGRGHSSPIVVGDAVYLTTADEKNEVQSVLCYSRKSGEQVWKTDVHKGGFEFKNKKASQASSSVACDGERLFVNFFSDGQARTSALALDGKVIWTTKICDYVPHQGYGSSPAIYGPLVIVSADNKNGGAIAGLDRETGEVVWRHDRPKMPNYSSPIIVKVDGRDQLIFTGCELVSSFDPLTGKKLWEFEGATTECVTTTPTDGKHVFTSGGYPKNHVAAVVADGSGKVAWQNTTRVYVPSMVCQDGYLYAVTDAGVATCWRTSDGKEMWKGRLGGTFSSSPVPVGERIYATNEAGKTFVFHCNPEKYEQLAVNTLGSEVFATPTIVDGQIFMRSVLNENGQRQEMLFCLGEN
jgi:hypothetical protein